MRRIRKILAGIALAMGLTTGLVVGVAADTAGALPIGTGFVVVNNSRCGSGSITGFSGLSIISNNRAVWSGGDWGDNKVWAQWDTNAENAVNGWAWCDRPWWHPGRDGWVNVIGYFTPRTTSGTYWV